MKKTDRTKMTERTDGPAFGDAVVASMKEGLAALEAGKPLPSTRLAAPPAAKPPR
jgi:hypothetical protein